MQTDFSWFFRNKGFKLRTLFPFLRRPSGGNPSCYPLNLAPNFLKNESNSRNSNRTQCMTKLLSVLMRLGAGNYLQSQPPFIHWRSVLPISRNKNIHYRINTLVQTNKKRQADKNTHARNSKINEENRTEKHKWKLAKHNHVQVKPVKQIPSEIRK
jgi:hypothetical protein